MAGRKAAGAPPWIITFADLMSLLLTLFVLMLSFADMDARRYEQIAGAMREAFGLQYVKKLLGISEHEGISERASVSQSLPIPPPAAPAEEAEAREAPDNRVARELREALATAIRESGIEVIEDGRDVIIRFPEKAAFPPGNADLARAIEPSLKKVVGVLVRTKGRIDVAGHTDETPISTARFRSNWDLAAARAVSVVHYLVDKAGLDPGRITAQGYAASRPLAPNDSAENRARNRRVEIIVRGE